MKFGRGLAAILGLMAAALAGPAVAQRDDSGFYLGGTVGYSQFKDVCKNLLIPCDDTDTSWRAFGGYQLNRNFMFEVGYAEFGDVTGAGDLQGTGPATYTREVYSFDFSGVVAIPLAGEISLLARLGAYRARTVEHQAGAFGTLDTGHTNTGFTYGLGAEFMLWKFGVRAEWQRYDNVGSAVTLEDDIDVFSVGARFRF
jgi:OOP family OmpA-OmpF porin